MTRECFSIRRHSGERASNDPACFGPGKEHVLCALLLSVPPGLSLWLVIFNRYASISSCSEAPR